MKVLVAGGTGVIGRPLVSQLVEAGHEVTVFSRSASRVDDLGVPGIRTSVGDALQPDQVMAAVSTAKPDVVINQLTNLAQTANPVALKRGMVATGRLRREASRTLVEAARSAGARRIVAQSISFAYAPGPGVRTESDALWTDAGGQIGEVIRPVVELEAQTLGASDLEAVVLRYGTYYGPGSYYGVGGAFTDMVAKRRLPIAGAGQGLFGFVHIDDAARATVAALEGSNGIFNIVDDVPAPSSEWITFLATLLGAKAPMKVPEALMKMTAGKFSAYLMGQQPAVSNARAKAELGWAPVWPDWHDGFKSMFDPS